MSDETKATHVVRLTTVGFQWVLKVQTDEDIAALAERVRADLKDGSFIAEDPDTGTVAFVVTPDKAPFVVEVWSQPEYHRMQVAANYAAQRARAQDRFGLDG